MIDNPCVKCKYHKEDVDMYLFRSVVKHRCERGHYVDDEVEGKKFVYDSIDHQDCCMVRLKECKGTWFEPKSLWQRLMDYL